MVVDQLHPLILAVSFKFPSFLVEFITLIIKVDNNWILSFYIFLCFQLLYHLAPKGFSHARRVIFSNNLFGYHDDSLVQATRGQTTKLFYIVPEYEERRKNLGASASSWTIKYYKVCMYLLL
jgi:hypothetical protein